ncbi:hypothetical protein PWT90_08509 [Aphanocladium album]|nr:hypothetical protein PWT90_08509 [Aphanocladium album]
MPVPHPESTVRFIDKIEDIKLLTDRISLCISECQTQMQPALYVDLEGARLSRNGSVSLMTILLGSNEPAKDIFIVDVQKLRSDAFQISGHQGQTLQSILQSEDVLKVFFDVRNDSDALFAHYAIKLARVRDIQLMESANRETTHARRYVSGLGRCIEDVLIGTQRDAWKRCKANGEKAWNPARGGSYAAFTDRPLSADILSYCVGDVQMLPVLYEKYDRDEHEWKELVVRHSQRRIALSQAPSYDPFGPDRAKSPWTTEENKLLDSLMRDHSGQKHYFSARADHDELGDLCVYDYNDDENDEYWCDGGDNDFEDWTRCPWQGPPS